MLVTGYARFTCFSPGAYEAWRMTAKRIAKANLPEKICEVCQRPYAWRKRWRHCWNEVRYCSERCRRSR